MELVAPSAVPELTDEVLTVTDEVLQLMGWVLLGLVVVVLPGRLELTAVEGRVRFMALEVPVAWLELTVKVIALVAEVRTG